MELIDLEGIKFKIAEFKKNNMALKETLDIENKELELSELEKKTSMPDFWSSGESQKVLQQMKETKRIIDNFTKLEDLLKYMCEIYDVLSVEPNSDIELEREIQTSVTNYENVFKLLETEAIFSGEYDNMNAIVTIHPGAGGTESQDWALMLYRMYTRWCERNGFEIQVFDYQDGEEAGIKSVTFIAKGSHAYGYLKGEMGVHRLVRISPFDSNSRRHTSFAAVDVMPEIDDSIELEIKDEDIEIGTFRASGAGGQHINKTDSAVRIKHLSTGISVSCQTERSQFQNKDNAMKMLKAKLYQLEIDKSKQKLAEIRGETSDNSWGNQIRSYVFCPYTLVKDHRTNYEIGNVQKVMDGYIDEFIYEYLNKIVKKD